MSGARKILRIIRARGWVVARNNSRLQIGPADRVTQELLERLAPHKPALLEVLEAEERPIEVGRMVGAMAAEFPGGTIFSVGVHAEWEAAWEAWRERVRGWWPEVSPLWRIELACSTLASIINQLAEADDNGVSQEEARARYCWGRYEALCEAMRSEVPL